MRPQRPHRVTTMVDNHTYNLLAQAADNNDVTMSHAAWVLLRDVLASLEGFPNNN